MSKGRTGLWLDDYFPANRTIHAHTFPRLRAACLNGWLPDGLMAAKGIPLRFQHLPADGTMGALGLSLLHASARNRWVCYLRMPCRLGSFFRHLSAGCANGNLFPARGAGNAFRQQFPVVMAVMPSGYLQLHLVIFGIILRIACLAYPQRQFRAAFRKCGIFNEKHRFRHLELCQLPTTLKG